MKIIATLILSLTIFTSTAQVDTSQQVDHTRLNAKQQQNKPYVILISADGFRYDYAKKYNAKHLLTLSKGGITAESMIPSYPSTTFPNHYSIVTGLYPAHHGLVSNAFFDSKLGKSYSYKNAAATIDPYWYGGTPLWTLGEQQKMLSASFYWVGSEAPVKNLLPTYYYHYNEKINIHDRIAVVKNWLSLPPEKRPHLITVYFPEVDHVSHRTGPESAETGQAVRFIDSAVYELTKAVKAAGVNANFVFLSDHGMTNVSKNFGLEMPKAIDTTQFRIYNEVMFVNLYAKQRAYDDDIAKLYITLLNQAKGYDVYLKSTVPEKLHYGKANDRFGKIGDIVLIPRYPHVFLGSSKKLNPGAHGFDPYVVKDMHAAFLAWGPNFKKGLNIASFENVNVYPIITKILGLNYTEKIDGTNEVANKILLPL